MPATVQILMPTYEPNEIFLRKSIQSILDQTFSDWTVLINNDASSVDVESIIKRITNDPRILFKKNPTRLGIGGNWNACVRSIDSPFVQFMFQDDVWKPTYLERCITMLNQDTSIGWTVAEHDYIDEHDQPITKNFSMVITERKRIPSGKNNGKEFLKRWIHKGMYPNMIGEPPFIMIRKELMNRAGFFDESLKQCIDVEYWIRLLKISDFGFISDSLGSFRVHGDSASAGNFVPQERLIVVRRALDTHALWMHPIIVCRLVLRWIRAKIS